MVRKKGYTLNREVDNKEEKNKDTPAFADSKPDKYSRESKSREKSGKSGFRERLDRSKSKSRDKPNQCMKNKVERSSIQTLRAQIEKQITSELKVSPVSTPEKKSNPFLDEPKKDEIPNSHTKRTKSQISSSPILDQKDTQKQEMNEYFKILDNKLEDTKLIVSRKVDSLKSVRIVILKFHSTSKISYIKSSMNCLQWLCL